MEKLQGALINTAGAVALVALTQMGAPIYLLIVTVAALVALGAYLPWLLTEPRGRKVLAVGVLLYLAVVGIGLWHWRATHEGPMVLHIDGVKAIPFTVGQKPTVNVLIRVVVPSATINSGLRVASMWHMERTHNHDWNEYWQNQVKDVWNKMVVARPKQVDDTRTVGYGPYELDMEADQPLTVDQLRLFQEKRGAVFVVGRVSYSTRVDDGALEVCMWTSDGEGFSLCREHNGPIRD